MLPPPLSERLLMPAPHCLESLLNINCGPTLGVRMPEDAHQTPLLLKIGKPISAWTKSVSLNYCSHKSKEKRLRRGSYRGRFPCKQPSRLPWYWGWTGRCRRGCECLCAQDSGDGELALTRSGGADTYIHALRCHPMLEPDLWYTGIMGQQDEMRQGIVLETHNCCCISGDSSGVALTG
jgi:hypothetical protein